MEDPNIKIGIQTTGADKAAADMGKVSASAVNLGKATKQSGEQMVRSMTDSANKARVSEFAFYDLGAAIKKVEQPTKPAAAGVSKMGFVANQVSMQVGDLATQVSMGGNALRAFGQQAPQVIGMLTQMGIVTGGAGIALGAVGALLPLISIGVGKLGDALKGPTESVEQAIEKVGDLKGKLIAISDKEISDLEEDLDQTRTIADSLKTDFGGLNKATSEARTSAIENASIMAKAEENINVLLGIRLDRFKQIREENERARKLRQEELAEQQRLAAEKRAEDQRQLDALREELEKRKEVRENLVRMREGKERQIGNFEEQRAAAQNTVEQAPGFLEYLNPQPTTYSRASAASQAEFDIPVLTKQIDDIRGASKDNSEKIRQADQSIERLQASILGKMAQMETDTQAAETSLTTLVEKQKTADIAGKADEAKANMELIIGDATKLRDSLVAAAEKYGASPSGESATQIFNRILKDLTIDPTEVADMQTAVSLARSSKEAISGAVLGGWNEFNLTANTLAEAVKALKTQQAELRKAVEK